MIKLIAIYQASWKTQ